MARSVEKQARRILAQDGGVLDRPLHQGGDETFEVAWVRTGPRGGLPVVVLPGGPGVASVLPYRKFRGAAAQHGLDVIMVEHRGVGLSGRRRDGSRLPVEAVTVESAADDVAAVLEHLGVEQAVVVGTSYGTYLAQAVAVRQPGRVAALVLDSPVLSVEDDLAATRAYRRSLLWEGSTPETARAASLVRQLAEAGEPAASLSHVVQVTYEFAGVDVLERLLRSRLAGRLGPVWKGLGKLGSLEIEGEGVPCFVEPAAVAGISYAQLGYGLPTDGGPLDPQHTFADAATRQPAFAGEPFDLLAEAASYHWPTVVVSGDRDLRTPRPVAEQLVSLAPHGTLVRLAATGHSALDTHYLALLQVIRAVLDEDVEALAAYPQRLDALPRRGDSRHVGTALAAVVRATTRPLQRGPEALRPRPSGPPRRDERPTSRGGGAFVIPDQDPPPVATSACGRKPGRWRRRR